ncbi:MAG: hypothetical protein ABJC66_01280 [Gammaproteobacteria bacterium]
MPAAPPVISCVLLLILGSAARECVAQTTAVPPGHNAGHNAGHDAGHGAGIWKAAVPPTRMRGEFDSLDPIGVAAGARIKADCSLNWIDPDDGKRYCFSSGTSLEFFLDKPQASIERARRGWQKLVAPSVSTLSR